jgi:transcription elongation factor SPT5
MDDMEDHAYGTYQTHQYHDGTYPGGMYQDGPYQNEDSDPVMPQTDGIEGDDAEGREEPRKQKERRKELDEDEDDEEDDEEEEEDDDEDPGRKKKRAKVCFLQVYTCLTLPQLLFVASPQTVSCQSFP